MGKPTVLMILLIVLSIDMFLFLGQQAVKEINPTGYPEFFTYENSFISQFDSGGYTINVSNSVNEIPNQELIEAGDTSSNIFTDAYSIIKNWFVNSPLGYLFNLLGAPAVFLNIIGLPSIIVFTFGAFWYGITLFLIINLFTRGE